MGIKNWPRAVDREEFHMLRQDMTHTELARHYKVTERTVYNWLRLDEELEAEKISVMFPPATPDPVGEAPTIFADRYIVIGDAEIPNHNPETFGLAARIAAKFNIKTLLINGDFIDMGIFSTWHKEIAYKLAFEDEVVPAIESIQLFLRVFDNITWVTGNHERRLAYRLDGHITLAHFFRKISGVDFSEHAYVYVNAMTNKTLVCHQDNYSKVPLSVPREIAAGEHCNIICGHTHHLSIGYDRSGKYWMVEGGHCRLHAAYKKLRKNTHPAWDAGFVMVLDDQPYLITPDNSNFWLNGIEVP